MTASTVPQWLHFLRIPPPCGEGLRVGVGREREPHDFVPAKRVTAINTRSGVTGVSSRGHSA